MLLAVLLNSRITGLNTVVNRLWNGTTTLAVASGRARAKFFGTSSPITMEKMVARKIPATAPMAGHQGFGQARGQQRAAEHAADGRLERVTGEERGQRDAQLCTRKGASR